MLDAISDVAPILGLSLFVSLIAVSISSVIGIALGSVIGMNRGSSGRIALLIAQTGMALPPVVIGLGLYLLLSRDGWLGSLHWLYTPQAMILAQAILALPFVTAISAAAIRSLPGELPTQLKTLGATPSQVRWTLLLEARPGLTLAVAAALGRSFSEVGAVLMVGGNIAGHTRVLTTSIVLETSKGNFELALALGGVLLLLAMMVNGLVLAMGMRGSH